MKKISLVVPMYNEEEMVPLFFEALLKVIQPIKEYSWEIIAVNDGSRDNTLNLLLEKQKEINNLVVVDLSRNWGHESAVLAGLRTCTGDAVIPMDADLQDPPEIIPQLIEKWEEGYQVVNAKRGSRNKDTAFKKNTAGLFYKLMEKISGKVKVPNNVANYRLIDKVVLEEILKMSESNRVFRIEVPYLGYKTTEVLFKREERVKGKSKYSFKAMYDLAMSSIVGVTTRPLEWPTPLTVGMFALTFISFVTELVFFILYLNGFEGISALGHAVWFIVNIVALFTSIILLVLSIISIYVRETVIESRRRPFVIINKVYKK